MAKTLEINNKSIIFFDCDGVLLDSNKIKTNSFKETLNKNNFDKKIINEFIDYHKKNGGISRFEKFNYLLNNLINYKFDKQKFMKSLLRDFSEISNKNLSRSKIIPGLQKFLKKLNKHNLKLYVVSGSKQSDLRSLLKEKKINHFFQGIYGSPKNKFDIITSLIKDIQSKEKNYYFGDSYLDYKVAKKFSFHFIYINGFSEDRNNQILNQCKLKFKNFKDINFDIKSY